jgi:hypothetical protein
MSAQPQQWQYMFLTVSKDGDIFEIMRPDGTKGILPPGEPLIVVLNRFGQEGWEVVREDANQGHGGKVATTEGDRAAVAHQSSDVLSKLSGPNSTTYVMKRPLPPSGDVPGGVL